MSKYTHPLYKRLEEYDFVLCSGSPRRLELLKQIGIEPIVEKSKFEEDFDKSLYKGNEIAYVIDTSYEKLMEVRRRVERGGGKNRVMLSADTVILSRGEIFEKPHSYEENVEMLKRLRELQAIGCKVEIITCCTLLKEEGEMEEVRKFQVSSEIKLIENISDEMITEYCKSGEGLEVAGGFKIQGYGSILFEGIVGDYYNCVGLPVSRLFLELDRLV